MSVIAKGISDVGCVRRSNEDSIGLFPELNLYIVADGMGGHAAGEVASQLAVGQISQFFQRSVGVTDEDATRPTSQHTEFQLSQAVRHANQQIFSASTKNPALGGMGTTIVVLLATPYEVNIAFVGDSRVYLHQNGGIQQLTDDHSLVNQYVKKGLITPEAAETHPQKHVLSRALGTAPEVEVETISRIPSPGDIYLLCSDGLSNKLSASELNRLMLETTGGLDAVGNRMVQLAKENGGEDNISVVLVAYPLSEI